MPYTDDDINKKRGEVQTLREQVAAEAAKRESRERGLTNDIYAAELDGEAARLRAELTALKENAKASTLREGATPLATERENAKEAVEAEKAAAKAAGTGN